MWHPLRQRGRSKANVLLKAYVLHSCLRTFSVLAHPPTEQDGFVAALVRLGRVMWVFVSDSVQWVSKVMLLQLADRCGLDTVVHSVSIGL